MRIGPALDVCVSSSWARSLLGGFLVVARFRSGDGGGCFSVLRLSVLVGAKDVHVGFVGRLAGVGVSTIPNFAVLVVSQSVVHEFQKTVFELDGKAGGREIESEVAASLVA